MKKTLSLVASLLVLGSTAEAGVPPQRLSLVPAPTTASCFNSTELQLDGFAVANFTDNKAHYGGGVGLNYYFTPFFGLGGDIYWSKISGSVDHNMSASALFRIPIEPWCSALYGFGGGGLHSDSSNVGTVHVGIGFEWRPVGPDGVAIFSDVRYTWADEDKGVEDAPQVRLGLRAIF